MLLPPEIHVSRHGNDIGVIVPRDRTTAQKIPRPEDALYRTPAGRGKSDCLPKIDFYFFISFRLFIFTTEFAAAA